MRMDGGCARIEEEVAEFSMAVVPEADEKVGRCGIGLQDGADFVGTGIDMVFLECSEAGGEFGGQGFFIGEQDGRVLGMAEAEAVVLD